LRRSRDEPEHTGDQLSKEQVQKVQGKQSADSQGTSSGTGTGRQVRQEDYDEDEEQSDSVPRDELTTSGRGQPNRAVNTIRDAKDVGPYKRPIRERRSPSRYIDYMALMTELIDAEPSSFIRSQSTASMAKIPLPLSLVLVGALN